MRGRAAPSAATEGVPVYPAGLTQPVHVHVERTCRGLSFECLYLLEKLLHQGSGPARVQRPGLGRMADVGRVQQQGQRFGLVHPVGTGRDKAPHTLPALASTTFDQRLFAAVRDLLALPFLLLQAGLHLFDLEEVGGHVRGQDHLNHQRAQLPARRSTHAV